MSLNKAIKHGKEKRKPYRGGKSVSRHCENHGGRRHQWECTWCKGNRTYQIKKERERTDLKKVEEYDENN